MPDTRLLRAAKNRYGSTEEVGVFEMAADGLREVADPGAAFVEIDVARRARRGRRGHAGGQPAAAGRGPGAGRADHVARRLAGRSPGWTDSGWRCYWRYSAGGPASSLAGHDVYASIVGGLTVEEPAIDLPLAVALASSLRDQPIAAGTVLAGEVGLTGELRSVSGLERRLREAARLGFSRAIVPRLSAPMSVPGMEVVAVSTLREALATALGRGRAERDGEAGTAVMPAAVERG